jgi:hypothetical protein
MSPPTRYHCITSERIFNTPSTECTEIKFEDSSATQSWLVEKSSQALDSDHSLLLRQMNINERIPKGERTNPTNEFKVNMNRITKNKRGKLEAMHTFQYFLLRQKTPPATPNTAEIAMNRSKAK